MASKISETVEGRVALQAMDQPNDNNTSEIATLERQADVLRNRIAAATSGLFPQGDKAVVNFQRQLARIEEKLRTLQRSRG